VTDSVDSEVPDPVPPSRWEADVVVSDGGTVHLRPIAPSDAEKIVAFHSGLSARTRYLRYFSAFPRIPEKTLYRFTHVDHSNRVAFVVELGNEIIALGGYERLGETSEAEVAFVVADAHQGRGIGSVLLEHLAAAAQESGIKRFVALVLAENHSMISVFRDAGYEVARTREEEEVTLTFDVEQTEVTEAVMREREQRAEARSISRLLFPRSVAVVGASNDEGKLGHAVFANLLSMGFDGPLYPVTANSRHVSGVPAYKTLLDVPGEVDLAVIAVPASSVHDIVEQCAARNVRGLVVISGGFGERGREDERVAGLVAQSELVASARANGMRVVGPNCLGVLNTASSVRLNASLAPVPAPAGRTGFFCQSGALGVAILGEAARRGLGVSTFVSAGNRADVSGNDLLQYWESDPSTDVVLMYMESFGNPRKFARLTRRLGRKKPIIAVKAGRGPIAEGLRHTTVEVPEVSVKALFEASGIIRVETLSGMFDVALLLASQPLPEGNRVAVVGNSSAIGVLVSNACEAEDLPVVRVDDVGVDASNHVFEATLRSAVDDPDVDAVVVVFVPPLYRAGSDEAAQSLRSIAAESSKPIVSTFLGFEGVPAALAARGPDSPARGSVPSYVSPERAVRALARAVRYAQWRRQPESDVPEFDDIVLPQADTVVGSALASSAEGRELSADECAVLLAAFGLSQSEEIAPGSVEVTLGFFDDRSFGALVNFGISGVVTELLADRAYAAVPLTTHDAQQLIRAPRSLPLLTGYRGSEPCDLAALEDLALRVSVMADALPEIASCELLVRAAPFGATIAAATIRVAPPTARPDTGPRRLKGL
jgi:acyl-CoA synthetase (NDP forming)/RimJ/RimL family protein N-acetyltransferase